MIAPNMATMLSFIFTDNFNKSRNNLKKNFMKLLREHLIQLQLMEIHQQVIWFYFRSIPNFRKKQKTNQIKKNFFFSLEKLMTNLAHYIVKDGEGASKFISISVNGTKNYNDAKKLALSI